MTLLSIIGLINFCAATAIAFFVILRNHKSPLHQSYFLFNISIAIFSSGYIFWHLSKTPIDAMYWFNVFMFGSILNIPAYSYFVYSSTKEHNKNKSFVLLFTTIGIALLVFQYRGMLYKNLEPRLPYGFWPVPRRLFSFFILSWMGNAVFGSYWLFHSARKLDGLIKQQLNITGLACAIGYLGAASNWPLCFGVELPPYLSIFIAISIVLIAYAILRYKLMDFNLLMRWSIAYGAAFLGLGIIFLLVAAMSEQIVSYFFRGKEGFPTLILCGILVFIFQPIRRRITIFVDQFIFKSPDFQSLLIGIHAQLRKVNTIESITAGLLDQFKKIWNVDHAGFAIWNSATTAFDLLPKLAFENQIINTLSERIDRSDYLVRTLETERRIFTYGIVVEEEIVSLSAQALAGQKATLAKIRRTLRWVGASVSVPLMLNTDLIGFIILGPKKNGTIYNDEDKKFLSHVAEMVSDTVKNIILNQPIDLTKLSTDRS